jgi:ribosomal subunit interface protein
MKRDIEFKNFSPSSRLEQLIESSIARLERHTPELRDDAVSLRLVVEENATRTLYHVSLTCDVSQHTPAAKEESHDVEVAVHAAFAEIDRQLEKHKQTLRKTHLYKRPARREEVRLTKAGLQPPSRSRRG